MATSNAASVEHLIGEWIFCASLFDRPPVDDCHSDFLISGGAIIPFISSVQWHNCPMKPTLEDGLRALREATDLAASIRIDLDEAYLRAIALVEARPENQSGADKSWVWRTDAAFRAEYRAVTRV